MIFSGHALTRTLLAGVFTTAFVVQPIAAVVCQCALAGKECRCGETRCPSSPCSYSKVEEDCCASTDSRTAPNRGPCKCRCSRLSERAVVYESRISLLKPAQLTLVCVRLLVETPKPWSLRYPAEGFFRRPSHSVQTLLCVWLE